MSPMGSLTEDVRRQVKAISQVHEKRAVELVNQELQRLTTAPSDMLIYAVGLLAYIAPSNYASTSTKHRKSPLATSQNLYAMGHFEIIPERAQAVRTLIQLKGGIDELSMPFQRILLTL